MSNINVLDLIPWLIGSYIEEESVDPINLSQLNIILLAKK